MGSHTSKITENDITNAIHTQINIINKNITNITNNVTNKTINNISKTHKNNTVETCASSNIKDIGNCTYNIIHSHGIYLDYSQFAKSECQNTFLQDIQTDTDVKRDFFIKAHTNLATETKNNTNLQQQMDAKNTLKNITVSDDIAGTINKIGDTFKGVFDDITGHDTTQEAITKVINNISYAFKVSTYNEDNIETNTTTSDIYDNNNETVNNCELDSNSNDVLNVTGCTINLDDSNDIVIDYSQDATTKSLQTCSNNILNTSILKDDFSNISDARVNHLTVSRTKTEQTLISLNSVITKTIENLLGIEFSSIFSIAAGAVLLVIIIIIIIMVYFFIKKIKHKT
jgi:hypothetical protein